MRVVQLGPFPPPHGGVQTNLVAIREYLRQQGHSCAVINITRHRKQEDDEIYYPESALGLLADLYQKRYDIVHLHIGGNVPLRVLALAFACTSVPRAKSILTFHSGGYPSSDEGRSTQRNSLRSWVFRRFDGIIAVNQQIVDFFVRLGVPEQRVRLIYPHSVAASSIAPNLTEPLASFFTKHSPVLLAVCLLEPEYDLARQIEAMEYVLKKFPSAGLCIIGSGSLEADLRTRIAAAPYRDNTLLCGDIPHQVTLRAIKECSLLLRTTLYDGDAISVREALYLETPVIATDNGMRPEGVRLIPIGDTSALVAAIEGELGEQVCNQQHEDAVLRDEANLQAVLELYSAALNGRL